MITRTLTAALAAAGMSLAGAPALAQAPQGAAQAQPQIAPIKNGELTDAQVEAFIDAATNIRAVIAEYQPKVDAAADREAAIKLQKEARGELVIAGHVVGGAAMVAHHAEHRLAVAVVVVERSRPFFLRARVQITAARPAPSGHRSCAPRPSGYRSGW